MYVTRYSAPLTVVVQEHSGRVPRGLVTVEPDASPLNGSAIVVRHDPAALGREPWRAMRFGSMA